MMSTSNEIPDRDFERQSTNRTRARPLLDDVMDSLDLATLAFPPARGVFSK